MKSNMIKCWFLLVLLMLAACQEKEELASTAKGSVSLKATIESDGTRTSVDEEGHVSWVETDAIGVFGEETRNAKFQSISSGSSVFFVGEMSSRQDIPTLAYYPYDENAVLDGNTLHFTLPSEYQYTGESNAPMLGIKQADGDFMFKHLCGLLKVTVKNMPENAKRLFVISEGTEEKAAPAITGDVLVNDVTANDATLSITENKGHEVSIDLKNTSAQETYTFYIPVPVGEYPKLSVTLEFDNEGVAFKKSISNVEMKRALMLDMPLIDVMDETVNAKEVVVSVDIDNVSGLNVSSFIYETLLENNNCSVDIITNGLPQFVFVSENENILMLSRGYFEDDNNVINAESTALALVTMQPAFVLGEKEHYDMLKSKVMQSSNFTLLKSEVEKEIKARKDIFLTENANIPILINKIIEDVYGASSMSRSLPGTIIPCLNNDPEPEPLTIRVNQYSSKVSIYNKDLYPAYECQVYRGGTQVIPGKVIAPTSNYYGILDWLDGENTHWGEPQEFSLSERGEYLFFCDMKTPKALLSTTLPIIADFISTIGFGKLKTKEGSGKDNIPIDFIYDQIGWNQVQAAGWGRVFWIKVIQDLAPGVIVVLTDPYITFEEKTKRIGQSIGKYLSQEVPSFSATYTKIIKGETFVMYSEPKAWRKFVSVGFKLYNIGVSGVNCLHRIWAYDQCQVNMPSVEFKLCKYDEITCCTKFILDKKESSDNQIGRPNEKLKESLTVGVKTEDGCDVKLDSYQNIKFEVVSGDGILESQKDEEKGAFVISSIDWVLGKSGEQKVKVVVYDEKLKMELSEPVYFTATFEPEEEEGTITTTEATNITQTTATLSGNIQGYEADDFMHCYGIIYSTDANPTASNGTIVYSNNIQEDGNYSVNVTSLVKNNTYYYRAFVVNGGNYVYGDVMNFTTKNEPSLRDALIELYKSTNGDNWINNDNWCSDLPIEEWYGISVDTWSKKLHIDLRGNNLTGFVDFKAETTEESNIFSNVGSLYFNDNNLTSIDISGIRGVNVLYCAGNPLSSVLSVNCPDLSSFNCAERNYEQSSKVDKKIDLSNCSMLNGINCPGSNIVELKIDGCSSLQYLVCNKNKLTSIDFTGCDAIYDINLDDNNLVSLDLGNKLGLKQLRVSNNKLTTINVVGCTSLGFIAASYNEFTSISLSGLSALTEAQFNYNLISDVSIENCVSLKCLLLDNNKLQKLDVSGMESLTGLFIRNNSISELNVDGCLNLESIYANSNKLATLDLSGYAKLKTLYCHYNDMVSLNLDGCSALKSLHCVGNKLTEMNVEHCTQLEELECSYNKILKEITEFFMNLKYFKYDRRYYYIEQDDGSIKIEEQRVGWWYEGEPEKLEHKP